MQPTTKRRLALPSELQNSESGLCAYFTSYPQNFESHEGGTYLTIENVFGDLVYEESADTIGEAKALLKSLSVEDVE